MTVRDYWHTSAAFFYHAHLHSAKIATAGERVEDMFYITNAQGLPLSLEEQEQLRLELVRELSPEH